MDWTHFAGSWCKVNGSNAAARVCVLCMRPTQHVTVSLCMCVRVCKWRVLTGGRGRADPAVAALMSPTLSQTHVFFSLFTFTPSMISSQPVLRSLTVICGANASQSLQNQTQAF